MIPSYTGNERSVELVGGPMPLAVSCVSLRLRVADHEFTAMLMPDRTVCIPEWAEPFARDAAGTFASQFDKDHRILVHELMKMAREAIRANSVQAFGVAMAAPPTLGEGGELVFRLAFDDADVILHVSRLLQPSRLYLTEDVRCDSARLFAAHDAALEYMQTHIADIEGIGFDTTVLRANIREWQAYRERIRIIGLPQREAHEQNSP